jgi:hypothetical protein
LFAAYVHTAAVVMVIFVRTSYERLVKNTSNITLVKIDLSAIYVICLDMFLMASLQKFDDFRLVSAFFCRIFWACAALRSMAGQFCGKTYGQIIRAIRGSWRRAMRSGVICPAHADIDAARTGVFGGARGTKAPPGALAA